MALGKNIVLKDNLIKKTTEKTTNACKSKNSTEKIKMTFYIEKNSLKKLYDYSYRKRTSLTNAFNTVLIAGLKDIGV